MAFELMTPVPEPGTLLLLGSGLLSAAGYGWKRTRREKGGKPNQAGRSGGESASAKPRR